MSKVMKTGIYSLLIFFFVVFFEVVAAQNSVRPGSHIERIEPMKAQVDDGDTLLVQSLPPVVIFEWRTPPDRKTRRLIRNVKKVYPYARLAGIKLQQYDRLLSNAKTEREKRRLMRKAEDELNERFGDDLKKLTFTQGHILLKLIDRETGETSYALLQELRGKFRAFFWQSFARIFGYDLKSDYDPDGRDKKIEEIVTLIEQGRI
jgi:hypothetical protein